MAHPEAAKLGMNDRQYFTMLLSQDPNAPGAGGEGTNASLASSSQGQAFQRYIQAMDQYGVTDFMQVPYEVRATIPGGTPETHYSSFWDGWVPLAATLAGGYGAATGLAAMGAGGATAGGAAAGTAAGTEAAALGSGLSAGAGGATGITAGTATGGIGGGALGSGLTAGGTTAAGAGTAAAGAGALGSGFFGSETAYPVVGGETAAAGAGAATSAATQAAGSTALQRILSGNGTSADYLSVLGQAAPSLLSAYGSYQQAGDYKDLAEKYMAMGAPYRNELARISADPNAFYTSPTATKATESVLQRLSATHGNPAGSPYAQALTVDALYDQYGSERDRLAGYGGLTAYNSAAPSAAGTAINAAGSVYGDIGYGIGNVMNPQQSLAQLLKQYGVQGGSV